MNITTVTTKGQVTIPREVRLLLGINVGDKIMYRDVNPAKKEVMIKVVPTKGVVARLSGSLKYPKMKYTDYKIVRDKAGYALGKKYKLQKGK